MRPGGFPPKKALLSLLAILLLTAPSPGARAQDDGVAALRAAALARQGRCEEALPLLEGAESADALLLRGKCQVQLRRYPDAVATLEDAKARQPDLPEVDLYLAMARFHQGDLDGARQALAAAEPTSGDRAEYHLYRGLLLLQQAESRDAAEALDRARMLGAAGMDPTASYYAGLAWAGAEDEERAREALERVRQAAPGSVWAEEATRALDQIDAGGEPTWWAWMQAGVEYDDNVVLRALGVTLPREIAGSHDVRGVWTFSGGYEFFRTRDWSAGITATYFGSAHDDLDLFDQHYPVLGAWLDRRLSESSVLRLRYDAGYAWVDYDPFLFTHAVTATLFQDWDDAGNSRLYAQYWRDNYLFSQLPDVPDGPSRAFQRCLDPDDVVCGPAGVNEESERNRDGDGFLVGGEHDLPLEPLRTVVTPGYRYHYFAARGSEYSYQGHEVRLETLTLLPWDLQLRNLVSYTYKPYRHASTFPDPRELVLNRQYPLQSDERSDDVWIFQVELEKFWTDRLSTSLQYTYWKNHSNVTVFDYDREITGVYVTYRFGP